MSQPTYVLVTPAKNEEKTIEITIRSVLAQTRRPGEWVIVSDRSDDETDAIVRRFASEHSFIRLLRLEGGSGRDFAAVVRATEAGIRSLQHQEYRHLGLLDADVRFQADYYERLLDEFDRDPQLGLAGGLVVDVINGVRCPAFQNLNEIAGATQFFKRECFESLGGLLPIPEGGWDAITCVRARMNGYRTRTFPGLVMDHLKPRNASFGNPVSRKWQMGIRDHALASHPLFELVKCAAHLTERPVFIGGVARMLAFASCRLRGVKVSVPADVEGFIHREQLARLRPFRRPAQGMAANKV